MNRLFPRRDSGRHFILTQLRRAFIKILEEKDDFGMVLDYGAKDSPYKQIFEEKCIDFQSADLFPSMPDSILLNDNGSIPLPDNSFDTLLSTQVLEHVEDVKFYLSEANRVLRDEGIMILSTHGFWEYHPDPNDFWRFTKQGLIKTISSNGFKILKVYSVMGLSASGLQLFQDGTRHRLPKKLKGVYYRLISLLQQFFDGYNAESENASVFVVLAQKST